MFPLNAWYVACTPQEIDDKPLGRKVCNESIVFYRDAEGRATALEDFCPHRGAPLSLGRVIEGKLVCGYHGLEMGCDGKTIAMPGQRVRGFPAIRSFPVVERHGFVWVWPGEAAEADEDRERRRHRQPHLGVGLGQADAPVADLVAHLVDLVLEQGTVDHGVGDAGVLGFGLVAHGQRAAADGAELVITIGTQEYHVTTGGDGSTRVDGVTYSFGRARIEAERGDDPAGDSELAKIAVAEKWPAVAEEHWLNALRKKHESVADLVRWLSECLAKRQPEWVGGVVR